MTVTALPAAIKMPMSVRGRSRERLGIEGMANHARYHHHRHVAASLLAWPLDHAAVGAALKTIGFAMAVLAVAGLASLLALREWWRWLRNPQRDDQPHSALLH